MKILTIILTMCLVSHSWFEKGSNALIAINNTPGITVHFTAPCQLSSTDTHIETEINRLSQLEFKLSSKISMKGISDGEKFYSDNTCFYFFVKTSRLID